MRMRGDLAKPAPGGERLPSTRRAPGAERQPFSEEDKRRLEAAQGFLTELFRDSVKAVSTTEWLTRSLNREPSYENKINDAIAGRDQRPVQLPWLAPLLDEPEAMQLLLERLSDRAGFMPPVRKKVAERAELAEAALEVIAEMRDEEQREVFLRRVAKKVGVRAEDVKL